MLRNICLTLIGTVVGTIIVLVFIDLALDETFKGLSEFQKQCRAEGGTHVVIEGQTLCFDGDLVKRYGE